MTATAATWVKRNLFNNWSSSLLTLLMLALFALAIPPLVRWAVTDATISGTTRAACGNVGACWTFIKVRFDLFFYGLYPASERWRVHAAFLLLIVSTVLTLKAPQRYQGMAGLALLTLVPVVSGVLLVGGVPGLPYVPTNSWGGLMLNVLLTLVAGVGGFFVGTILAFGRRSRLPVVRWVSVSFIELWRGVPLLTVLFMAMLLLPMFMPRGVTVDNLVRAMLALTLFTGAYMAEIIRGGLQAIPRGQIEAATALGMRPWIVQLIIVLPQALRLVIPGLANTVIDLFKDTTLVSIVGLFDLLGVVNQAQKDQAWLGMAREGYAFAAAVFFLSCFAMSMLSRMAEQQGANGTKRKR
jgi:general L-amino acid transport system permease protein